MIGWKIPGMKIDWPREMVAVVSFRDGVENCRGNEIKCRIEREKI